MKITITAEDIDSGSAYNAGDGCPATLALQRRIGHRNAFVGIMTANGGGETWHTSRRLQLWIESFDSGQAVEPASFILIAYGTA